MQNQWIVFFERSDWLLELGIDLLLTSQHFLDLERGFFPFFRKKEIICRWLSTDLVFTKQLFTSVSVKSGRYLPPLRWIIIKYPYSCHLRCVKSSSWRKIGKMNVYSFVSRWNRFELLIATIRLQYCQSSAGDEVDCLRVAICSMLVAAIGAFRSSLLFPHRSTLWFIGCCAFWSGGNNI